MDNDIFVVMVNDRHSDIDVTLFYNKEDAIEDARKWAKIGAGEYPEYIKESTTIGKSLGWVFYISYGESDSIIVMKRGVE